MRGYRGSVALARSGASAGVSISAAFDLLQQLLLGGRRAVSTLRTEVPRSIEARIVVGEQLRLVGRVVEVYTSGQFGSPVSRNTLTLVPPPPKRLPQARACPPAG